MLSVEVQTLDFASLFEDSFLLFGSGGFVIPAELDRDFFLDPPEKDRSGVSQVGDTAVVALDEH